MHVSAVKPNDGCLVQPRYVAIYDYYNRVLQYCAGGKIEKNEMGGACDAYGGGERCAQGSSGET